MIALLAAFGRNGRRVVLASLVTGLALGLVAPDLPLAMQPLIAPAVVVLLALAVMRIGPDALAVARSGTAGAVGWILGLQLALPAGLALALRLAGLDGPDAMGLVVALTAAPIVGSPSLVLLCGGNPAQALRLLVLGTLLLPLTALPVFALLPAFGDPALLTSTTLSLAFFVMLAGAAGLAARSRIAATPNQLEAIDGATSLLVGGVVVVMMAAAGPALGSSAGWRTLAIVMLAALSLQITAALVAARLGRDPFAHGIIASNRNIALLLGTLPAPLTAQILGFVGLYQIPMYLTPVLLPPLYRWLGVSPTASRQ